MKIKYNELKNELDVPSFIQFLCVRNIDTFGLIFIAFSD